MAREKRRRRIELGFFEAAVLLFGYLASLCIVGVAGIFVGQRAVRERLGNEEQIIRLPISKKARGTVGDLAKDEPEITFYDRLGKRGRVQGEGKISEGRILVSDAAPAPATAPVAREAKPATKAATQPASQPRSQPASQPTSQPPSPPRVKPTPSDKPHFEIALAQKPPEPPKTTAKTSASRASVPAGELPLPVVRPGKAERPAPEKPPVQAAETPVRKQPSRVTREAAATARAVADTDAAATAQSENGHGNGRRKVASIPSASGTPRSGTGVSAAAAATAPGTVPVRAHQRGGIWSVQVNATREAAHANKLAQRLRERGYDAFIVEQARDGVVWYRVRVGRLPSLELANALVREIKQREGLPHAFVASD
jgi:cell division septation protein DedD